MTKTEALILSAVAATLTFGIAEQGNIPLQLQTPLWNGDLVIVNDETRPSMSETGDTARKSTEMGKADGVQGAGQR
jgi:hypothetical protein